jgi:hypothetical protein
MSTSNDDQYQRNSEAASRSEAAEGSATFARLRNRNRRYLRQQGDEMKTLFAIAFVYEHSKAISSRNTECFATGLSVGSMIN